MQDAFNAAALAPIRPAGSRTPPSRRAPNGVLVPTLLIAGEDDTWSFREGLLRELVNAPEKKHVTIPHATHFVLFETQRVRFFESSTWSLGAESRRSAGEAAPLALAPRPR